MAKPLIQLLINVVDIAGEGNLENLISIDTREIPLKL